ncbi:unnamed protein product [Laminaria digitata]
MELIEQGLEIQGVTAIEDKLQAGVPDALRCLRQASLKVRTRGGNAVSRVLLWHCCRI